MAIFDKSLATALKISCACTAFTAASAAWAQDRGKPPAPAPRTTQEPALAATPDVGGRDDIIVEALKQGAGTVIEAQAFMPGRSIAPSGSRWSLRRWGVCNSGGWQSIRAFRCSQASMRQRPGFATAPARQDGRNLTKSSKMDCSARDRTTAIDQE